MNTIEQDLMNKITTPRQFIKDVGLFEINEDNESDSSDIEWTMIEDLLLQYAAQCASVASEEIYKLKKQLNDLKK